MTRSVKKSLSVAAAILTLLNAVGVSIELEADQMCFIIEIVINAPKRQ